MSAFAVKVAAARAAGALSRRTGRGGTSLPGKLLMRLEPHAIARLGGRLERGSAVISATNGKTTTAAMVAGILERAGAHLVHNRAGANMAGGVAAALMAGPPDGDTGLFEVDEFWLGQVVDELQPRAQARDGMGLEAHQELARQRRAAAAGAARQRARGPRGGNLDGEPRHGSSTCSAAGRARKVIGSSPTGSPSA